MPTTAALDQMALQQTLGGANVPEWAQGVLSTKGPSMGGLLPRNEAAFKVVEDINPQTALPFYRVPGLCVLAIEQTTDFPAGVELARRLKVHELDLAAMAVSGSISEELERALVAEGILLLAGDAESPRARARKYAEEFASRGQRGLADLERFFAEVVAQR